ncbi:sugar phosphate isomerase/epimerase family protein [Mucilaginibacter auburnensis]|uniref:Sugar phosphate isomerase/epimerase n=1 Tax=Mucilaginibacter auburnensis TaxID=1457233 RepID=A0A2H9VMU9_9SPHI|nr:sugar phosphate isomerase/epimerase [Mucilaginibacter auburnensis]PJJ79645.1 sugar phosphate isomerase/epimerase [Mucilaginibacter auburnensis]
MSNRFKAAFCGLLMFCCLGVYAQSAKLFPEAPGLVSYTFRKEFQKDMPGTLDMVKKNGITDMEFSNLFGQKAEYIRQLLDERGIKCSSFGVSYEDAVGKLDTVAVNAKKLGAKYVRVASIPHKGTFTLDDAKNAVTTFNAIGKTLKEKYGLTFIYHNHGFEFEPYEEGTLYDYIVKNTNPQYVSFELDILWAFFPGHDPAELLKRYPKRYKAMHLKDLNKGVKGDMTGWTSQENDVVLGTGQINIPAIIKAAKKAGIEHYYIEDESSASVTQVPQSIAYLNSLPK